ncbi:hypothetical protein VPH35_060046 [Triticum aestivum]
MHLIPRGLGSSPNPASAVVSCHLQQMRPHGSDGCSRGGRPCCFGKLLLPRARPSPAAFNSRDPPDPADAHAWERCCSGRLFRPRARRVDNGLLPLVPSSIPEHNSDEPVDRLVLLSLMLLLFTIKVAIEHPWQVE